MAWRQVNLDSVGNEIDELINMARPKPHRTDKGCPKSFNFAHSAKKIRGKPPAEVVQTGRA
ncbi:MAG: hypothetical protein ACLUKN_06785 [Bacilli bacterium]